MGKSETHVPPLSPFAFIRDDVNDLSTTFTVLRVRSENEWSDRYENRSLLNLGAHRTQTVHRMPDHSSVAFKEPFLNKFVFQKDQHFVK